MGPLPHVARLVSLVIAILLLCLVMSFGRTTDSDTLLMLKDSLANTTSLRNWNPSIPPCSGNTQNWVGVLCLNGNIWGLRLDNMGVKGLIDVDFLIQLPYLRKLSFRNNHFDGSMPNINKLGALKSLFLWNNHFSGEIPDDAFAGMDHIKKLYLSNNQFRGKIPSSLAHLPRLLELRLDGNQFEGQMPDFQQPPLKMLNVSNNELEGPIPASLSIMELSSFSGNQNLCGQPLEPCKILKSSNKTPIHKIVIIVIVVGLVLLSITVIAIIIYQENRKERLPRYSSFKDQHRNNKVASYTNRGVSGRKMRGGKGKLIFIREEREKFDLQELLRASAEVLGSGTFGASYKAEVLDGQELVVKRYKQMNNVGREDFHEHIRRLGRLQHPNLLPLVAYYYRKQEKLLVFDFLRNGSLASHLHRNQSIEQPGLDWPTRLKIIKGVVKGLAYLHSELPSLNVPHGHLKSSNVVLQDSFEPLLTDYALFPVINIHESQNTMVVYKSPEHDCITKKSDVWSLGILMLEMLTGKFPENYVTDRYEKNTDLGTWVNSMVEERRTEQVFDREMGGTKECKGKMIEALKIGLSCCEEDVDRRMELGEVVKRIQELKETDNDQQHHSIDDSEGNVYTFIDM